MTRLPLITRWGQVCLGMLLLTLVTLGASAASPKRVLILDPFGHDVAPFSSAISAFRTTLAREMGASVDLYEVPLDLARFAGPDGEGPLAAFLEDRVKNHPVDLVVSVGGAGVQFAARHRERLFPNTPVLVVGSEPRMVPPEFLRANSTLVAQKVNLPGMVEDILQLQPQTTNIAVVFGTSALESFWGNECRREFQAFTNRVGFTWLDDLSLEQVLERCAMLPPRSFILHVFFLVDAARIPYEKNEALRRLHAVANAPLFGYFASEFGLGPIGGRLYRDSEIGVLGARTAIRILRGERPESIPPQVLEAGAPIFDWRELQRWGIGEARLPAGSVIQFRQPGFWELYRWPIIGTALFCLLQAALIIRLLVNRAKRRQGEAEATLIADISTKFVNLPASEIDREIVEAQRRICDFLGLDLSALWQWSMEMPRVVTMTHLYRPLGGPPLPEPMYAHEHFPWCQQQLEAGRMVLVSSIENLADDAVRDQEVWRHLGIKSIVTFPLSPGGGPVIGALSFNTVRQERNWPEPLLQRLQLVAQIFANALARKRADQALRVSEERMTLAAEAAEFGVWAWNLARNQVWGSESWLRLFGFVSGEDVSFEKIIHRIHPDDRKTVELDVRRALRDRADYAGEYRVVLPNGTQRWIAARGRLDSVGDAEPGRMLGASVDITSRKRAEEAAHSFSGRLINAQEEERARLGRELHDDITQRLARLAIDVGRCELGTAGISPADTAREVREELVRLSEDVHALSYRLHPAVLEDLGLAEALKAECERFSGRESVPANVKLQDFPAQVPRDTALCLFRVAQEALRNVARHARARTVEVSLRVRDDGLQLAIQDDGDGFDPTRHRERPSLGLASMRERVHLLGGELDIDSAPGHGATILAWVPLGKAGG